LYDNRSYVLGSMFGGHKNAIPKIMKMVDDVLMDKMIAENNVNNEQIALGYLSRNILTTLPYIQEQMVNTWISLRS